MHCILQAYAISWFYVSWFVVLSLFTEGFPNTDRKYSDRVGGTRREKRGDNKTQNHEIA